MRIVENHLDANLLVSKMLEQSQSGQPQKETKQQMLTRQVAWCVLLGIDSSSEEYRNFENLYFDVVRNQQVDNDVEASVLRQIEVDVYRTFRSFNLKFLNAKVATGQNKLFNVLKVYALILDPLVAYT